MAVALTFASGAVGGLVGSYDSSYAYPETHYVEVNGSAGRVQIVDTVKRFTHSVPGREVREVWEPGYFNDRDRDFDHMFELHLDEIVTALRRSEEPPIHARAGRRACSWPTRASSRSRRPADCRGRDPVTQAPARDGRRDPSVDRGKWSASVVAPHAATSTSGWRDVRSGVSRRSQDMAKATATSGAA